MIILGINDGHNASATLIVDGDIIIALEEERLQDKRGQWFSKNCLDYLFIHYKNSWIQ